MARGKFIVFEGGEGSGKSTMLAKLKEVLPPETVFTRNPGGTFVGNKIREVVLSDDFAQINLTAELLLFEAGRAQLSAEIIAPALEKGVNVLCDRFELTVLAYQIYGHRDAANLPLCRQLSGAINQGCVPDMTILLDIPPDIGLKRAMARSETTDRVEREPLEFHERVREGYLAHIGEYKSVVIDASRPLEEVWKDVYEAVQSVL